MDEPQNSHAERGHTPQKESTYYMIPFIEISRKHKLIYGNREQISSFPGTGSKKERNYKETQENFAGLMDVFSILIVLMALQIY